MKDYITFLLFFILTFGAWFTHVVHSLVENLWGILLVGVIFPPVGIIHGWVIWWQAVV